MFAELITPEQLAILGQIIFIDLVLAGDNAIIIGMVASKFPVEQRKKIIFWGIGGAVILRIILTLLTAYLLQITGLRLLGGLLLLYIVYKLYVDVIKGSEEEEDIKRNTYAHPKAKSLGTSQNKRKSKKKTKTNPPSLSVSVHILLLSQSLPLPMRRSSSKS